MRNLKVTLAYDGADLHGWQVQPGLPTVQGLLAEAIFRVIGEQVLPQGSGRTDAGVHALAQVASFAIASSIPAANLAKALNDLLPAAVRVANVEPVPDDFHARKSAHAKTYRYRMYRGAVCPPFLSRYVYHHPFPLDEAGMIEAASLMVGEHDFTSFAAVDRERNLPVGQAASHVRTIFGSEWRRDSDEMVYSVRGNGFLHHMVRNLVGTFLLVGKGTLTPCDLLRILEARDRSAAGATAPACGLYLVSVEY